MVPKISQAFWRIRKWQVLFLIVLSLVLFNSLFHAYPNSPLVAPVKDLDLQWPSFSSAPQIYPPLPEPDNEEYMSVCISVLNGAVDMPEFFAHYYHHMGIRRFYVMDDGSNPPLETFPDYGIPKEAITFHTITKEEKHAEHLRLKGGYMSQAYIYDKCNTLWGHKHTWMGFMDIDEFLEMIDTQYTLKSWLKEWEKNTTIGAIGANWRMHTSAGLIHKPTSNRAAFDVCVPDKGHRWNAYYKSFVRTAVYVKCMGGHHFRTSNNTISIGELGDQLEESPMRPNITREKWGMHHYILRSKDEFQERIDRGDVNGKNRTWDIWDLLEASDLQKCDSLVKYYP
jgi:Glycosyltransferase family 92